MRIVTVLNYRDGRISKVSWDPSKYEEKEAWVSQFFDPTNVRFRLLKKASIWLKNGNDQVVLKRFKHPEARRQEILSGKF